MSDNGDDVIILDEDDSIPKSPIYVEESSPESQATTPRDRSTYTPEDDNRNLELFF